MSLVFACSFAFIVAFLLPLWYDASRRSEYGDRPRILLASLIGFGLIGAIYLACLLVGGDGRIDARVFLLMHLLYPAAFVVVEYSVHRQRIKRNLLLGEFKSRLKWAYLIAAGMTVAYVLSWVISSPGSSGLDSGGSGSLYYGYLFVFLCALVVLYLYGQYMFDLQAGIIRRRRYLFIVGACAAAASILMWLIGTPLANALSYLSLLALNAVYAVRVFHEYFMYRMQHLNDILDLQSEKDRKRIDLINKILVSSEEEDIVLIKDILAGSLERLKNSIPKPELRCKSMMLFRKKGNIMAVDTEEFILDYCVPLFNLVSLKGMKPDALHSQIRSQVFDIEKIMNAPPSQGEEFAEATIRKMLETKAPVSLAPIPEGIAKLFKMVLLYPIYNKGEFNAMLVLFKDQSDYLFPQEKKILEDLSGDLSIANTLITGKQVQADKNRLNKEMDVARQIQVSVLPRKIEIDGYDIAAEMLTATEVGGDLYDYIPTSFGNYLDVGDVAGHGLPAGITALIHMAALHSALCASEKVGKELSVSQLYDTINSVLVEINRDRIGSDKFMTGNVIKEKDGRFQYAGAHLIGLVYRAADDAVEEVPGMTERAAFLGISEYVDSGGSLGELSLGSGDVLLLYTDGLVEARDRNETLFGLRNLKAALSAKAREDSETIKVTILEKLRQFAESGDLKKNGGFYTDDVSLVVIKKR